MSGITHLTLATAGHIDHGKSSLVEALTGVHPDRLKEEQSRGISIELGFAHAEIDGTSVSFVDVPGHERFVRHMLAGIGGIDGVLFVVAADASVMPQTREHLAIASLLGVPRGIIALTKADLVDDELLALVRLEVEDLVSDTPLAGAPIVPVSVRTGQGLDDLRRAIVALADTRDVRDTDGPARLPVDRVFTVRGFGTVVTGTLWTGRLQVDGEVTVLPGGSTWRIRGLQVHGQPAAEALAGQRVAVNLAGAAVADLARGDVLTEPGGLVVTRRLDARVQLLSDVPALRHGARVHLHLGTSETLARVSIARSADVVGAGGIEPGAEAWVRLRLEHPLPTRRSDRFVLRSYSPVTTIAGGVVIDPQPPRRTSRASAAARLETLAPSIAEGGGATARAVLRLLVDETRGVGVDVGDLPARLGLAPAIVQDHVAAAVASGDVVRIGTRLVAPAVLTTLAAQVVADVDAHHASEPASDGLPRQSVRERLGRRGAAATVDHVVTDLVDRGVLTVHGDRLARPAHVAAREALAGARTAVQRAAQEAGLGAVTAEALRLASGLDPTAADAVVRHLVRDDVLLKLGTLYVDAGAVARVVGDLRAAREAGTLEAIDVGWFKERYGVTRRTAIPLLELLDRLRVTRRVGETRLILAP
jgi:selenocysteine-specific elongation factor